MIHETLAIPGGVASFFMQTNALLNGAGARA